MTLGFLLRSCRILGKENSLPIQHIKSGKFITPYETFEINLIGLPFEIEKVEVDNIEIDLALASSLQKNILVITKEFTELRIMGK